MRCMTAIERFTHRSFGAVRNCGCGFLKPASDPPIIMSCSRELPFFAFSDTCCVAGGSLLVIVVARKDEDTTGEHRQLLAGHYLRRRYKKHVYRADASEHAIQSMLRESGRRKSPLSLHIGISQSPSMKRFEYCLIVPHSWQDMGASCRTIAL